MRARAAVLAAVLISTGLGGAVAGLFTPHRAAAATPVRGRAHLVVVAAVPDLRWTDVAAMPSLRALAAAGAVGLLTDKTIGTSTGCLTGMLAIAAGTRTSGPAAGGPSSCRDRNAAAVARLNRSNAYAANVTALGGALFRHGVRRWVVDAGAYHMLGGPGTVHLPAPPPGSVDALPDPGAAVRDALRSRKPAVVAGLDPALLSAPHSGPHRRAARSGVDAWLGSLAGATPKNALLVVVGSSDAGNRDAHLHVAVLRGPGVTHHALTSASTNRAPYVQLIDVAPTVLHALHLPLPAGFTGSPMTVSSAPAPTVRQAVDADRHAVAAVPAAEAFRALLITLASVALALALLGALWRPARPAAVALARVVAPLPLLSWLAQLIPWWRAGATWLVTGLAVFGIVIGLVMTVLRQSGLAGWVELVALPGATAALLIADQLAGGGLQLSAPLGDNPLEAGRFSGVGNAAFAVLLGSALLVAAACAGRMLAAGRSRPVALGVALAVSLFAVAVDGAPQLGDDLGGLLSAVPAVAVTLVLLAGWRITRTRALAITAGAVALGVAAAVADYARPAADQTHLGHFVAQLLHGGSGTTLQRKVASTLQLQGEIPLVLAIVALLVPAWWWDPARVWLRRTPGLGPAVVGLLVLIVLGSLLNDSGVAVLGFVIAAAAPAVVAATVPTR